MKISELFTAPGLSNFVTNIFNTSEPKQEAKTAVGGTQRYLFNGTGTPWDGEKNFGGLGTPKVYSPMFNRLRARSWQAYLDSEVLKMVIDKMVTWMISNGLELQATPNKLVLESEKVNNTELSRFSNLTEARFKVWSSSNFSTHSGETNLFQLSAEAFKNTRLGGDVLVVLRVQKNSNLTVQLVDGANVQQPAGIPYNHLNNGIRTRDGIEIDAKGKHIAYHVQVGEGIETERILAYNPKNGMRMAYMVYGMRYREDDLRGIPLAAAVLETLNQLGQYKDATLMAANEVAKSPLQIVHQAYSTGASPFLNNLKTASNINLPVNDDDRYEQGRELAQKINVTRPNSIYNNPVGAEMKPILTSNSQINFANGFYDTNLNVVCACLGIPVNVAMSIYNDSFSASRAATKDWDHTMSVQRANFSHQFYKPIYTLWLHLQIMTDKVTAPGYLTAIQQDNQMLLAAYRMARFTGPSFPHIDPLKEVKAVRAALPKDSENMPLISVEQATQVVNGGDADYNMAKYAEEKAKAEELGLLQKEEETKTED